MEIPNGRFMDVSLQKFFGFWVILVTVTGPALVAQV